MEESRLEQVYTLAPGTYVFEVSPGPRGGTLTLADGREVTIGKEGGRRRIRIQKPQEVVISYQANGRPPAEIKLQRVR